MNNKKPGLTPDNSTLDRFRNRVAERGTANSREPTNLGMTSAGFVKLVQGCTRMSSLNSN